ncbi:MAG: DUF938 domain-containing protein [Pseudoalteromonas sp.]|uniref:DUF938 domain-containing protein n=1 Tax=unclassified Pseudoalteromonas TaxID=194690 RepID=UPI003F9A6AF8
MIKPYSQACENNKEPILLVLKSYFCDVGNVLEVGSGTGQHSVYFAAHLPHLQWHTSDRVINHAAIELWHREVQLSNLHLPIELDLNNTWPVNKIDAIFSANTLHIISWTLVERFFTEVKVHLPSQGKLAIYGPFKYQGQYTSESNQAFDQFLKRQDEQSGIRDFEAILKLAEQAGLILEDDIKMPANNQILLFKRQ